MFDTVIEGIFSGAADITLGGFLIGVGSALVLGIAMAFMYMYKNTYTKSFAITLATLASTGNASAGTTVKLTDSSGNVIAEFTPTVSFQTVVISTPDITSDGTYTLTVGDSTQEITMSGYIYGSGMGGGFGGGNPPDMNGGQNGNMTANA